MEAPQSVNRKQFIFLLIQFMMENRIQKEWFEKSKASKFSNKREYSQRYFDGVSLSKYDDFKTHLSKCVDIYINNTCGNNSYSYYDRTIRGFFRFIPSSFMYQWKSFWHKISEKWENKYYDTKYIEHGNNIEVDP